MDNLDGIGRRPERFILNAAGEPEPCADLLTWAKWMKEADRHVAKTTLPDGRRVSTVFLGLDHGWGKGPPILFETMVFKEETWEGDVCKRYATKHDALVGHQRLVAELDRRHLQPPT